MRGSPLTQAVLVVAFLLLLLIPLHRLTQDTVGGRNHDPGTGQEFRD
jgi:hypothetical protein